MEKYCPKCFKKYPPETEVCPADGSFLVSPHEKDLTGEVLDNRYTVLERIGRGGMGVVYRAEQHLIKRIVALKVLRREVVQDESAVRRFLTEAQAIASLDSRHTVTLYDFGVTRDGLLYYTMELLKGRTVAQLIRKEAPLDVGRAALLVVQVCDSLKEAHGRGILHRDLKPDNLFVVDREGREAIKVVDFGIAKLVGDSSVESVTRTGMIIGTPQYLSPEQALGNPVVPASDLYSLAIVFYEMLAGVPPFQDETPMKTMWAHIRDPVPALSSKNPKIQVPRSIEAFLTRALEKEPGKRFPTTVAFRDALRKAIEDHNAAPETVSLPSLSTTGEGLRLKTQAWDGEAGGRKEQAAGPQTAVLGGAVMGERPDPAPAAGQQPPPPSGDAPAAKKKPPAPPAVPLEASVPPAPSPMAAEEEKASPREAPAPAPATARAVPLPAAPLSPESDSRPVLPNDSSLSVLGPETMEMLGTGRRRLFWAGAAAVGVALFVALLVWRPWTGGDAAEPEPAREVAAAVGAAPVQAEETEKAETERKAEEAKETAEALRLADARSGQAEEAKKAEEARMAAESEKKRKAEEGRKAEEAEKAAKAEAARKAEEARKADKEKKAAEAEAARQADEKRKADEAKKATEAEAARRAEEERKAEDKRKAEATEKRAQAEAKKKAEEKRKALRLADARSGQAEEAKKKQSSLQFGRKEMQAGRYEKAIALFNEAKQEGADIGEADRLVKECYDRIRKREIRNLVSQGKSAFEEKNWAACVKHFEAAVKLGGSTSEVEQKLKKCRAMTVF